ncbi:hypothetical protein NMG46_07030 [Mesorhizobium sp. LMG 17147]|uniref:hypothetical protein n=1 Tax=Mesorhizobium sp. LMG 17147 TaxID=2963091 RepID=UPI0020C9EBB9|nr:hypothetical protein [Mesorhizobium sp. LMG 17147]MCP9229998.1 hypothetical protein [Mesorhizobium sp. LMG 17147]
MSVNFTLPRDDSKAPSSIQLPVIEKITVLLDWCYEPGITWKVTLADHGSICLPVREVLEYRKFRVRCAEELRVVFGEMKADLWAEQINAALPLSETLRW